MLFGKLRFKKDLITLCNMPDLNDEQASAKLGKMIGRLADTNLIGGMLLGGAAATSGALLGIHLAHTEIEKKQSKELKDTDK